MDSMQKKNRQRAFFVFNQINALFMSKNYITHNELQIKKVPQKTIIF